MAYKAEHVIDMETGAILAAEVLKGTEHDAGTLGGSLTAAEENWSLPVLPRLPSRKTENAGALRCSRALQTWLRWRTGHRGPHPDIDPRADDGVAVRGVENQSSSLPASRRPARTSKTRRWRRDSPACWAALLRLPSKRAISWGR